MTSEQQAQLQAAKLQLLYCAVLYSIAALDQEDHNKIGRAEHDLAVAAKDFTRTVDAIDHKLWEPPQTCDVGPISES